MWSKCMVNGMISDNEIDSVCILREMIEVREGMAKCDFFFFKLMM